MYQWLRNELSHFSFWLPKWMSNEFNQVLQSLSLIKRDYYSSLRVATFMPLVKESNTVPCILLCLIWNCTSSANFGILVVYRFHKSPTSWTQGLKSLLRQSTSIVDRKWRVRHGSHGHRAHSKPIYMYMEDARGQVGQNSGNIVPCGNMQMSGSIVCKICYLLNIFECFRGLSVLCTKMLSNEDN